jgi:hypothetical protein
MTVRTALAVTKNHPRYLLGALVIVACSYAIDRWFFSGLTASKWIGLPQYASAMNELLNESRNWGIIAVILGAVALVLVLPRWPKREGRPTTSASLALVSERSAWTDFLLSCTVRAGLCLLGIVALAILIPFIGTLLIRLIHGGPVS